MLSQRNHFCVSETAEIKQITFLWNSIPQELAGLVVGDNLAAVAPNKDITVLDGPDRRDHYFPFIGMKVNTSTLSQPVLCYHRLQRAVGWCQVGVMKWEERVHRHQQRKVHSLLPPDLLSENLAFNYRLSLRLITYLFWRPPYALLLQA